MNALVHNFDFEGHAVRMQMLRDEPWFVLTDVCRVLDIKNARDAASRLDDDEKDDVGITDAIGRQQKTTVINESGLYSLILTSRKDEAKRFKKWVTSEVLPAIRRTGFYMAEPGFEFPLTIDGKVFGLPIAKVNAAARLVAVAKGIYGPEAARALWESDRTLPKLGGMLHCYLDDVEDSPEGCFRHLLRSAGYKSSTVGEMLHLALTDRTMNAKMHHYGILAGAVGSEDRIAIAHQHPFLARVYGETCWVGDWKLALIKLPGAVQSKVMLQFGPVKSKAVLLPREEFLKLYLS